jgi:WD40 repeat protein
MGRTVAVSLDGSLIVVGSKAGTVTLFDQNLKFLRKIKLSREEISDIKFSPDKKFIGVGSHDNAIYMLRVSDFK